MDFIKIKPKASAAPTIRFWSSTEYSGFLAGLMRELTDQGFDARQRYQISEANYRSAKSAPARLFLRFRQYVVYPAQLIAALAKRKMTGDIRKVDEGQTADRSELLTVIPSNCDSVAVVSTNTFYAPLIATYLHPHVVHLVYDLFPEAMIHSGKWTEGTLKVKFIRWITKQTLKRAKANVFLGERLKAYVESIHGPVVNSAIIAVGADQSLFSASPKQRLMKAETLKFGNSDAARQCEEGEPKVRPEVAKGDGSGCPSGERGTNSQRTDAANLRSVSLSQSSVESSPTILYCGNFGNMHDSATLFQYWKNVAELVTGEGKVVSLDNNTSDLVSGTASPLGTHYSAFNETTWLFCCSGPKRVALETELAQLPDALQSQIQLGSGLDQAAWIETMESADVALVTMSPGAETVVMPSKTYSAMMAGQAILAIAPEESDLVDLIKAADCGWWVVPGDVAGLAAVIEALSADQEGLLEKRERAYQYAHAYLGQDALAKQWLRMLHPHAGDTAI